ncbi:M36 family metallopeptidase [Longispora albida]|uniref:M36 family metallopeptidase n=1 Tax=Longispora albida TaxID=203523 RepID=UPI000375BCC8|nr:M36 family metallopeptidase [Longispora albida]
MRSRLIPAVATVVAVAAMPAVAFGGPAEPGQQGAKSPLSSFGETARGDKGEFYDARSAAENGKALQRNATKIAAQPRAGLSALKSDLGVEGVVELDSLTGTFRQVSKLDGFLTGPSKAAPDAIALNYLRDHTSAFGLSASDINRMSLRKVYVDVAGNSHLSFIQTVDGVPVFGNGYKAHVSKNGELISIDGSPLAALPASLPAGKLTAATARDKAIANVGGQAKSSAVVKTAGSSQQTTFASNEFAQKVVFQTVSGPRSAWETIIYPGKDESYTVVLDAETGAVLYRRSLTSHYGDDEAHGSVFEQFPGALRGGDTQIQNLRGLPKDATKLSGNIGHVYLDLNDDNAANPNEEVGPAGPGGNFVYPFTNFIKQVGAPCSSHYQCSWNPNESGSWQVNAKQNAVQMYYFLGRFGEHLEQSPIGFTREAGNFDSRDGDGVQGQAMDGANTASGMPDGNHANNANMSTPPDGFAPRMQMYLFYNDGSFPWTAANSGDDASILYHEFGHGLSNRLVVDALGRSTLGNIQAGAMGEAWSDWYAMDFLVGEGYTNDRKLVGDVRTGEYVGHGLNSVRSQPIDCKVGWTAEQGCPGTAGAGPGGYTYGDFGKVRGVPQVHADGEIWSETLWDLRRDIGSELSRSLVTRGMELAPANPSYLDMRNAILLADRAIYGGANSAKIWQVFAARGMGFFAAAFNGDDSAPAEDFSTPPPAGTAKVTVSGQVVNASNGAPIAGALVSFAGHPAATGGSLQTVTDASGNYSVQVVPGTYKKFNVSGAGYEVVSTTLVVTSSGATANYSLVRDWAAEAGGATIAGFNGDDYDMFGCGPRALIDQSQGGGWSSDVILTPGGGFESRFAVIKLPQAIDIADIKINPSNTCGDAGSSSTGAYKVETSVDGTTWTLASNGTFGVANRNKMNSVTLAGGTTAGVKFVKYTMLTSQVPVIGGSCPGPFTGCQFVDSVELAVYGNAS